MEARCRQDSEVYCGKALALAFALLLAVVSGNAAAEWVQVGSNATTTAYADPATIRRAGDTVKMWDLLDFKAALEIHKKQYLSQKSQTEHDCKEEQSRILYVTAHSENMGAGVVVNSESGPGKWLPISPGSIRQSLWDFACRKR